MTTPIYGLPPGVDAQQFQQFQQFLAMQQSQGMSNPNMQTQMQQNNMQQMSNPNMQPQMQQNMQPQMQPQQVMPQQQVMTTPMNTMMPQQQQQFMMTQPNQMMGTQYPTYQQVPGMMSPQMMMMPGFVQQGQFVQQGMPMAQPQAAAPSNVPQQMHSVLNWITSVATDWEKKVFQDKKMKPDQIMSTMFELREKWNQYFTEYKKNQELGADKEFKALLDGAAEKTTLLIERLRANKKKTRPFMNSTRLTELCLDIDKMVDYDSTKKAKIVNNMKIQLVDDESVVKIEKKRTVLK